MDFASLPPEINSGRLYTGPGSAPMLAAAEAWEHLAAELFSTASSYRSVIAGLTAAPWVGPSSTTMAAAASSYAVWMSDTAIQVEQTASQARAAAAAYETAFAATVPPEIVAANRSLLLMLVATNLLGQNTPAIAATEAQYAEMWAQDVGAMFGYAGSSALATQVTPFNSPVPNTNSAGLASQAAAVGQAGQAPAGIAQSTLSQIAEDFSAVPSALSNMVSLGPIGPLSPLDILDVGADLIAFGIDAPVSPIGAVSLPIDLVGAQTGLHTDEIVSGWQESGVLPEVGAASPTSTATNVVSRMVTGAYGEGNLVGGLSVPATWTAATPAVVPVALQLPATNIGAEQLAATAGSGTTLGDMALAGMAGRAVGDTLGVRSRTPGKVAPKGHATVGAASSTAEESPEVVSAPRAVVTGIAAEIREFAELREQGLLTDEQFIEQRNRLLGL
ncbi:PPE family protein, SVP subgroup [Mycobacterium kubicae]|uniref:PPE family protein, SVP subgroup n=1 Tax=Mycobacterium kubicae TaxID=120959 RepID=UPI00080236D4|nr:PPE domain-containing protein [Mycobacterium kubicae]OBK49159.1 hypothetical protein A5657_22655 [Mycobacterium kubicae]